MAPRIFFFLFWHNNSFISSVLNGGPASGWDNTILSTVCPHLRRWGCTVSRNCFNLNILIIKLHNPYTHCLSSRSFPSYDIFFVCIMQLTLHVCQSEWPKDKPFLLMHSRHARNLYNSKIKIIFEIAWTLFEIILFIHLDRARSTYENQKFFGPNVLWSGKQ